MLVLALSLNACFSLYINVSQAQTVRVRESLGTSRAFLVIRDDEGKPIGRGEFTQTTHGTQVFSKLSLHFRDGSLDEETSRFTQGRTIRFVSDHHVQRGPTFPKGLDMTLDSGGLASITTTEDGKEKKEKSHIDITEGVVNGLIGAAILNRPPNVAEQKFSFIAPVGSGRKIQLKITPERHDKFSIADTTVSADVYRIHYELGGLTGLIAPLVGKQPEDTMVWVTSGVPSLVREQTALYSGGPTVSLELSGATFQAVSAEYAKPKK